MKIDRAELRTGLAETRRFLLAHHQASEFYRCYSPTLLGRRVHVCARCAGIYPGIVAGFVAYVLASPETVTAAVVAILPLPALVDWSVTTFRDRRGWNVVRTLTGSLLGFGYGLGLALLLLESAAIVLSIGAVYAILSGVLLYYSL